ncbi:uncharacterized protein LOC111376026 [Olea europaea var. sylvestris]|uniref:uncharacterized protein LOC111376026 n=1 Tax=Olea europaea var. sylvestris TaxID=158386 RepID=UPI000C1D08CA|nr:uncharacterized protein LOC111376026 [Olea europaea var. sylvestris]
MDNIKTSGKGSGRARIRIRDSLRRRCIWVSQAILYPNVLSATSFSKENVCMENVIASILSISDIPIYVLIDFGAIHSLISNACLAKINVSCQKNDSVLELGENRATIVCFEKEVIFRRSREEEFRFYGTRIKAHSHVISALKAESVLRKVDCEGYLVSLTSTSTQEKVLGDVAIVRENVDVFPKDLPGTLADRKVKFTIDLIPRATPVSKAPYRMALKELQDLKMQLEEQRAH